MIENVLAGRYASLAMREIWDPTAKVRLERRLWVSILEAQQRLGLTVPDGALDAYRGAIEGVDLESIESRERHLRHDLKARIEEFNALAGFEAIHLGMTSRDVTENVELLQIRRSLELVLVEAVAAVGNMGGLAAEYSSLAVTGRTHNVPAQVTTVGKRIANAGEELAAAIERLEGLLQRLPLRGVKGPVGTQQDQAELLGGPTAAEGLDAVVAGAMGFQAVAGSVGQIYPRSLDLDVVSALVQLAAGPANFTNTLRLMAGHDLATEGFRAGQVGSSAMPHKMNTRTSERVHGFKVLLGGHLAMAVGLTGEQWNEGDVTCSVVRRVMLPDAFFAIDGLLQSFLVVLDEMGFYPAVIERELAANLPFLATTRLLVAAVQAGMGREAAHETIKRHAVAAALARREASEDEPDLLARLASDPEFPLGPDDLAGVVGEPLAFAGLADRQVEEFGKRVADIVARHPEALDYRAGVIL
jgi:adenylosuccinate lyase